MQPQDEGPSTHFIIGNVILGFAAVMLLFFGALWEHLGVWALFLWMVMAVVGVYFISKDSGPSHSGPPN